MMKRLLIFCALLWVAFAATGIAMHRACQDAPKNSLGWTDIAGYDSEAYLTHWISPVGFLQINHRHPFPGLVTAPVTVVGMTVAYRIGAEVGQRAVICCFALVGAFTCLLLCLILKKAGASLPTRIVALALWLSFAHVWILAGAAEFFALSQPLLLGVLLMVQYGVRDYRAWLAASALTGSVTVTNGIKPLIAWIVAADGFQFVRNVRRRTVVLLFAGVVGGGVLLVGFLAVKWWIDGIGFDEGIRRTVYNVMCAFPREGVGRSWFAWNAFWCEPMMLHENVIAKSVISQAYRTMLPHLVGAAVLGLCLWSAIRNFRLPIVRAALAMVGFDVLLHIVLGWGIEEGQIYCGHWFWIIPLLVGLLPPKTAFLTAALAACIALHNCFVLF